MRTPARSPSGLAAATKSGTVSPRECGSAGSGPAIACNISAVSITVRVIGVMCDWLPKPSGVRSCGTSPSVCLKPTTPQHAAGMRLDPPPSVPTPIGTSPAATEAAAPPLDPPHVRDKSHGLTVRPKSGASVKHLWPNSGVVVLPMRIAPAALSRATDGESAAGTLSASATEPKVVFTPAVLTRSLTANGTPCSGGSGSPSITAASASQAAAFASSAQTVMNVLSEACDASMRASASSTSSTGETPRLATSTASSAADVKARPAIVPPLLAPRSVCSTSRAVQLEWHKQAPNGAISMADNAGELSAAEASVLLSLPRYDAAKVLKIGFIGLIAQALLRLKTEDRPGFIRTRHIPHLRLAEGVPAELPPISASLVRVVRAAAPDGLMKDIVAQSRREFGRTLLGFVRDRVIPSLVGRGLV